MTNENPAGESLHVVATGTAWVGQGVGSVQSAVEKMLEGARREIQIAIFEISKDGSREFLDLLRKCLARGIIITLIINRYHAKAPEVRKKVEELRTRFPYFNVYDFTPERRSSDLHAKIVAVDRKHALVGSANLTWNGMTGNHELALAVSGKTAYTVAALIDILCRDPRTSIIEGKRTVRT